MSRSQWQDYFIPAELRSEPGLYERSKMLVYILTSILVVALIGEVVVFFARTIPNNQISGGHGLIFLEMIFVTVALFLFRRYGSFSLAGNMLVACIFASLLLVILVTGVHYLSPAFQVLPLIPILAFLLVGRGWGLVWTALTITSNVLLVFYQASSQRFVAENTTVNLAYTHAVAAVIFYALAATCYIFYAAMNRNLNDALLSERSRFQHQARSDELTGINNRAGFFYMLNASIGQAESTQKKLALVYIDLNKFKPINDSLGHHVGDEVLKGVASNLTLLLRKEDVVGRLGGDEFAVLLRYVDQKSVALPLRKILKAVAMPLMVDGQALQVSASLGVAFYPDHGDDVDQLCQLADEAMYQAKKANKPLCFAGGSPMDINQCS